jgi:hypothetical protein
VAVAVADSEGEQRRLALGIAVKGPFAQAQSVSDVLDLGALVAVGDEHVGRGVHNGGEPVGRDAASHWSTV